MLAQKIPSYEKGEKTKCFADNMSFTETEAKVPIQDLLNRTAERLIPSIRHLFTEEEIQDVTMMFVCGL